MAKWARGPPVAGLPIELGTRRDHQVDRLASGSSTRASRRPGEPTRPPSRSADFRRPTTKRLEHATGGSATNRLLPNRSKRRDLANRKRRVAVELLFCGKWKSGVTAAASRLGSSSCCWQQKRHQQQQCGQISSRKGGQATTTCWPREPCRRSINIQMTGEDLKLWKYFQSSILLLPLHLRLLLLHLKRNHHSLASILCLFCFLSPAASQKQRFAALCYATKRQAREWPAELAIDMRAIGRLELELGRLVSKLSSGWAQTAPRSCRVIYLGHLLNL